MGDVITHARITAHVVEQLKRTLGPKAIPEDDYTYIELGNFLTDVKQFRDPPAFHSAREAAREAAQTATPPGLSGPVGVDDWAVTMFGRKDPPGPRHGAVPEFLRLLAYVFTHEVFDADGLARLAKSKLPAGADPALIPKKALPAAEVDRVMEERFDQYWPHDHMDFPKVPEADLPRHREDRMFQRQRLGYIGFLQKYIAYVAQELTKLEAEWATAAAVQLTDQQQRDFLVRLGTLLHAVEDFYFHSNMAELRQWQLISRLFSGRTPEEIFRRGLAGIGLPDETKVRLRRIFYRRLRYPVFESGGTLSLERSEDATDLLYTGGFYQTDVYHTLGGALEGVERFAPLLGAGHNPADSKLVLVRLVFSEDARRDLVRGGDDAAKALRDEHAAQLANGDYTKAIADRREAGTLAAAAADRLDEAFALDKAREEQFKFLPGPGAILINLLGGIQRERDESARAAMSFDATEQSITIERTNNDASAENIGTHSLMSKDSDSKQPFRDDALVLAKHASAGVATVLAARIKDRRRPLDQGIDWLVVLPFFLRFPKAGSLRWEEELLTGLRESKDKFKQPDVDAVREQPPVPFLGPTRDPQLLARQRAGKLGEEFRAAYRSFEQ